MATLTKELTTYNSSNTANGKLRLTFTYTQSVAANQSYVYLSKVEFQSSTQTGTLYADGIISINGEVQVTYTNSGLDPDKCVLTALNTYAQLGDTLDNPAVTITHGAYGSGSIPVYIGPRESTGYTQWNIFNSSVVSGSAHIATATVNVALPTIADTLATATPLSPVNSVEDGSSEITFKWRLANDSGLAPTKTVLQKSTDGTNWTSLATIDGDDTEYSAPANTFSAGTVYWRARAYNRDNVAGNWSAAVNFVAISAPSAPTVQCDGKPYATITWRASGQQAYEIRVVKIGISSETTTFGPFFGAEKSYKLDDYLENGPHFVSVRVQGAYGLWSEWGSADVFTVANDPYRTLALKVKFGIDARLQWTLSGTTTSGNIYVYRDGKRIGEAKASSGLFIDRLALGTHSYTAVFKQTNGYYTKSNEVKGTLHTETVAVAPYSFKYGYEAENSWIYLPLSDKSDREQSISRTRNVSMKHYLGAEYPVLEASSFYDLVGSYDCAFACPKEAEPFLALFGKTVIVKSKGGEVIVGPLSQLDKTQYDMYTSFSFSVQNMAYDDYTVIDWTIPRG